MIRTLAWVAVLAAAGCTRDVDLTATSPDGYVAAVRFDSSITTVAFCPAGHSAQLPGIVAGDTPSGFDWVSISLPTMVQLDFENQQEITVSLDALTGATVVESMTDDTFDLVKSGENGASGQVTLRLGDTFVVGDYDVNGRELEIALPYTLM